MPTRDSVGETDTKYIYVYGSPLQYSSPTAKGVREKAAPVPTMYTVSHTRAETSAALQNALWAQAAVVPVRSPREKRQRDDEKYNDYF